MRNTSIDELEDVIDFWLDNPRGTVYRDEITLGRFLRVFTPAQIKGAMYLATSRGRSAYFRYLCGILHNWKHELDEVGEAEVYEMGNWDEVAPVPTTLHANPQV